MKTYFNPGCALSLYKPEMELEVLKFLNETLGEIGLHKICCHHEPQLDSGSLIINVCPGCDKRFTNLYDGISTISIWRLIDGLDSFTFPDYKGLTVSVHDACPVRKKPQVHQAVRRLLKKMNIDVIETKYNGTHSICCGDNFYPHVPVDKVHEQMKKRADSMPCDEVCVYCVSCVKSMYIGGKTPRYLLDLLFGERTEPPLSETVQWHERIDEFRELH
jgi:hypothetical protein